MTLQLEGQLDLLDMLPDGSPTRQIECLFCGSIWGATLKAEALARNEVDHREVQPGICAYMRRSRPHCDLCARPSGGHPRKYCPECGSSHGGYVRAVGIFRPVGTMGYLANFEASPIYSSRQEAERAACRRARGAQYGMPEPEEAAPDGSG